MDPVITVSLSLAQWNQIGSVIPELPMRVAQPLMNTLGEQIQKQIDAIQAKSQAEAEAPQSV